MTKTRECDFCRTETSHALNPGKTWNLQIISVQQHKEEEAFPSRERNLLLAVARNNTQSPLQIGWVPNT